MATGGKNYRLFAKSYLGFGMNQARLEYFEILSLGVAINGASKALAITNAFKKKLSCFFEATAAFIACRAIIRKTFFSKFRKCPFHDQHCLSGDFFEVSEILMLHVTRESCVQTAPSLCEPP